MKFLLILIVAIVLYQVAESCEVKCDFFTDKHWGYYCRIEGITAFGEEQAITGICREHETGKTDNDVKGITSYGLLNFFPKHITNFFPNIEYVHFSHGNITAVTKDDLSQFNSKLKRLFLNYNKIEVIEADLLADQKDLEVFYINNNNLRHVEGKAFEGLKNLKTFYAFNNPCTAKDDHVKEDRDEALKIIEDVEKKCKDENYYRSARCGTFVKYDAVHARDAPENYGFAGGVNYDNSSGTCGVCP